MGTQVTPEQIFSAGPSDPLEDVYSVFKDLRDDSPAIMVDSMEGPRVFITRFEYAMAIMKDDKTYSSKCNAEGGLGIVMGRTIVGMDGKEHVKHRNIVTPSVSPKAMRGDFPELVETIANDMVDCFIKEGQIDLKGAFTFLYPLRVFVEILGTY